MKKRSIQCVLLAVFLSYSFYNPVLGAETPAQFQLKSGEMSLLSFLESTSECLGLQINASELNGKEGPTVSVSPSGPRSREQAMAQVYSVLAFQGYTLVQDVERDLYRLMRQRDARDSYLPLITDESVLPNNDSMVTHVIPLKHLDAAAAAYTLRSFSPAQTRLIPEHGLNAVLVIDSARSMKKYRALVSRMDHSQSPQEAEAYLKAQSEVEPDCVEPLGRRGFQINWVFFGLAGLVLGFLIRGYVISRTEGGI